jgi:hypothetical protein
VSATDPLEGPLRSVSSLHIDLYVSRRQESSVPTVLPTPSEASVLAAHPPTGRHRKQRRKGRRRREVAGSQTVRSTFRSFLYTTAVRNDPRASLGRQSELARTPNPRR